MCKYNRDMKSYLFLVLFYTLITTNGFSQNMESARGHIFYEGVEISLKEAKEIALDNKASDAFEYFKKAKRVRNWNICWLIIGGYEVGAGGTAVAFGNPFALLDVGIGLGLIGITALPNRNKRIIMYVDSGVEAFNNKVP